MTSVAKDNSLFLSPHSAILHHCATHLLVSPSQSLESLPPAPFLVYEFSEPGGLWVVVAQAKESSSSSDESYMLLRGLHISTDSGLAKAMEQRL